MKRNSFLVWVLCIFFATACTQETATKNPVSPTLYDRLGGVDAITLVVDQFIANVAVNPDMERTFQPLLEEVSRLGGSSPKLASLRNNLIDQMCEAAGGPQMYRGKDMVTAHRGMNITAEEFNSMAKNLSDAIDKFNVPAAEKNELMAVIASLQPQIVGK
ncbi:MAG: group I truncated hemoglobin [Spirosomataceae bacterium]